MCIYVYVWCKQHFLKVLIIIIVMCNTYTNGYNDHNVNYRCISDYTFKRSDLFFKKELMLMLILLFLLVLGVLGLEKLRDKN
jgi:hypothetical protein